MAIKDATLSLHSRAEFIMKFSQKEFDPFKEHYMDHLRELAKIIKDSGTPLEGNIFYDHWESNLSDAHFSKQYLPKRRTLAMLGLVKRNILEIGFNSGFSALLLLTANPHLRIDSIDLCTHKYTKPCYEYLKRAFGDRICLYEGNSLEILTLLSNKRADYDAYIIDGGHATATAESDLFNIISFSPKGSLICFDDSDFPQLRVLLNMHMLTGNLISVADHIGYIGNVNQMFFLNNKSWS